MRYLLIVLLWWFNDLSSLSRVSAYNRVRREAEAAFRSADYRLAAQRYMALLRLEPNAEPALWLNLGHTYFSMQQYNSARQAYQHVTGSEQADQSAMATVQLGVIACAERDSASALDYFQQALLRNPDNEPARYNFELIKRQWSGNTPLPPAPKKPIPKKTKSQQNATSSAASSVAKSDRQTELLKRFRNMNMSEQQALQLLNAMQDDDLPYALIHGRGQSTTKTDKGNRW